MNHWFSRVILSLVVLALAASAMAQQKSILFDAMHAQTAGNADWVLDEDSCGIAQRFPTPDQAGITSATPETYWSGAFSAMGVDLVKKGFRVESLPPGARISYGDTTNVQDLDNYDVFVLPEPNTRYTAAEITAIRNFVQNGGGLMLIADHAGSDRNSDGWDSPKILNELMGTPSIFGLTFGAVSTASASDWFNNAPDANYTTDTTSPIIFTGPFGNPQPGRGLGLFGSTSMTLSTSANATVKGHIWKTGATVGSTTLVTFATAEYGTGRVAAIGDSSPAEDKTNNCSHTTHLGYNDPQWDNAIIFLNAYAWLTSGTGGGDPTAPTVSITAPAAGATVSGTVAVNATASDNVGVTKVEFYLDGALKSTDTTSPYSWSWGSTTTPNGSHSLTAKAFDAAGNDKLSTAVNVTVNNPNPPQQLLGNPGFESGTATPWTASTGIIDNSSQQPAKSGLWKAWLNGYGQVHTDTLRQTVTIPATATSATLTFWLHIDTAESGTTPYDTLKVQIRNSAGTSILGTLATYSNANANTGYTQRSFNVLNWKGQTVQVYLLGAEDETLQTSFVVDDFALNVQ